MSTWKRKPDSRPGRSGRFGGFGWTATLWVLVVAVAMTLTGGLAPLAFAGEPESLEPSGPRTMAAAETGEDEGPVLSLADALRLALQHSPRVQRAASATRQSAAEQDEAHRALGPRVDVTAGLSRAQDPLMGTLEPQSQGQVAVVYQHVIAETEDTRLTLDGARLRADIARAQEKKETLQALADVVDAYVAVLEAESGLRLSEVMARNAAEGERVVRERLRQGAATETDLLAAETAARRARQGVKTAQSSLRLAYEALYRVIGLPVPSQLPRLEPATKLAETVAFGTGLDELIAHAREFHPDLLQAQRALEAARLALRQVERADRPRLELTGAYGWPRSGQRVAFTLDDRAALGISASHEKLLRSAGRSGAGNDDTWRLGVQVSFNLMDAGAGAAREAKAQEQVRQAALQLEEATAALFLALAKQYDDVAHAWRDVAIHDAEELEAQRRYGTVSSQFAMGSATQLDLWQAEGNVLAHRTEGVRARAKALRAATALAVAAGADPDALIHMFAAEVKGNGSAGDRAVEQ